MTGSSTPLPGQSVLFESFSSGTFTPSPAVTDAQGIVTARWTLGSSSSSQSATARASGAAFLGTKSVDLFAHALFTNFNLDALSGGGQSGQAGQQLRDSVVVKYAATDEASNISVPVVGATVQWVASVTPNGGAAGVANPVDERDGSAGSCLDSLDARLQSGSAIMQSGGGSLNPTSGVTDAQGRVSTRWTLGSLVGTQSVRASATDAQAPAGSTLDTVFTATGTSATPSPARMAYTVVDASGAVDATLTFNSRGGSVTASRQNFGTYHVLLGGLATPAGGKEVMQVTGFGSGQAYCNSPAQRMRARIWT